MAKDAKDQIGKRLSRAMIRKPLLVGGLVAAIAISFTTAASAGAREYALGYGDPSLANVPRLSLPAFVPTENAEQSNPDPPAGGAGTSILWGYEAFNSTTVSPQGRILQYNIANGTFESSCTPADSQSGRGVAMDPLDGNLWYTFVNPATGFSGDGMIHKVTPPLPNPKPGFVPCAPRGSITYDPQIQNDLGALSIDPSTKNIWAAGYKPITINGVMRSYFYLIQSRGANAGQLLRSCWTQFRNRDPFDVGNDSLSFARIENLPGSGKYLLTDAGEIDTGQDQSYDQHGDLLALDVQSCSGGNQARIMAMFPKQFGMTGIDYQKPGLLNTDTTFIRNLGTAPFDTLTAPPPGGQMSAQPSDTLEGIAFCGFTHHAGGDSRDTCPFAQKGQENCDDRSHSEKGDGDVSDNGDNSRHFNHDACEQDETQDHMDYRDSNKNVDFHATRIDLITHDPVTHAITMVGMGVNVDHLTPFTAVILPTNLLGVTGSFSITLGDGYSLPPHSITVGSVTLN